MVFSEIHEGVHGDKGRIADLAVSLLCSRAVPADFPQALPQLFSGGNGITALCLFAARFGEIGPAVVSGMSVVQPVFDQTAHRLVRRRRVRAHQIGQQADIGKIGHETVNIVGILQAVQTVQFQAQLVQAVIRQGQAALAFRPVEINGDDGLWH